MSNQVYSDLTAGHPYLGRDFSFQITFVGDADVTKTILIGAQVSRVTVNDFALSFTTQNAIDWGALSTSMVAADGAIPANYRPGINHQCICWLPSTTNPFSPGKLFPAYAIINTNGGITIRKIKTEDAGVPGTRGDPATLSPGGALCGNPIVTFYYTGPSVF